MMWPCSTSWPTIEAALSLRDDRRFLGRSRAWRISSEKQSDFKWVQNSSTEQLSIGLNYSNKRSFYMRLIRTNKFYPVPDNENPTLAMFLAFH